MKITSVKISGMHNVEAKTYDFNDIAYLYGKNGAGKSTVMQAIQLALLGYIPGTDKTKTAIFRHAGADLMSVSVTFDTGQTVTRMFERSGNNIKTTVIPDNYRPEHILGELELPVFNFNEFASMTANKLKDWFIGFLPDEDSYIDWPAELQCKELNLPDDQPMIDAALFLIDQSEGNSLDKIRHFNEYCKQQISNYKFEITRLESTLKSLVYYDDFKSSMTSEEIAEKIRVKEIELDVAKNQQSIYYSNAKNLEEMETIRQRTGYPNAVAMGERLDAIGSEFKALGIKEADLLESIKVTEQKITEVKTMYEANKKIINGNGICPYTHSECANIMTYVSKLIDENAGLYDKQNDLVNALSCKRNALSDLNTQKSVLVNERDTLGADLLSYAALNKTIVKSISIDKVEADITAIAEEIGALREAQNKLLANTRYEELKSKISTDLFTAQHCLEVFKAWEKITGVNALQSRIMVLPFEKFSEKISIYLKQFFDSNVSAKFCVGEKSNSFSFGIDNGRYIQYDLLSSGEKCLYTLSLLMAIVESSDAPMKLVLVDDILDHLDSDKIKNCFTTLYNSTIQTVIAGVQKCEHEQADQFVINI